MSVVVVVLVALATIFCQATAATTGRGTHHGVGYGRKGVLRCGECGMRGSQRVWGDHFEVGLYRGWAAHVTTACFPCSLWIHIKFGAYLHSGSP